MKSQINNIEDIYPLTIVKQRYSGKIVIVEGDSDYSCVSSLQGNEEWSYHPHEYMDKEWAHINYGIGSDIYSAFEDFKKRYK